MGPWHGCSGISSQGHDYNPGRRASAYGLLDTVFGLAWFTGSAVLGVVYDRSVVLAAVLSAALQLSAIPLYS
jgi:uncharacterized membrane protein